MRAFFPEKQCRMTFLGCSLFRMCFRKLKALPVCRGVDPVCQDDPYVLFSCALDCEMRLLHVIKVAVDVDKGDHFRSFGMRCLNYFLRILSVFHKPSLLGLRILLNFYF